MRFDHREVIGKIPCVHVINLDSLSLYLIHFKDILFLKKIDERSMELTKKIIADS